MDYRTIPPTPDLAGHVRFFWTLESEVIGEAPHRLTAESCPGLVFICQGRFVEADGSHTPPGLLAGPLDTYMNNTAFGPFSLFGVYLWPWASEALFEKNAGRFINTIIALEALWGAKGRQLATLVPNSATHAERECPPANARTR
jgi:hypothetical protein